MGLSWVRGHKVVCIFGEWVYADTHEPVSPQRTSCGHCNLNYDESGHDPCIKNLSKVKFACCGHGVEKQFLDLAYVWFEDDTKIRGQKALDFFKGLGRGYEINIKRKYCPVGT